jgi:hypothetical protein
MEHEPHTTFFNMSLYHVYMFVAIQPTNIDP